MTLEYSKEFKYALQVNPG